MTFIFALIVVGAVSWLAGWTGLEHLVIGIPVLILGIIAAASLRWWLRSRAAGEFSLPVEHDEQPPGRRVIAGLALGTLLSLLLAAALHAVAKTPFYIRFVDARGRALVAQVELLESLQQWSGILALLSGPRTDAITPQFRRRLIEKKVHALIRLGESTPDIAAGCERFREAETLGRSEGIDTKLAATKLEVCAARLKRRPLPPGSSTEILRIESAGAAEFYMSLHVIDADNRAISGLAPGDFALTAEGRPLRVLRAEAMAQPVRRNRHLAFVVESSGSQRVRVLSSVAFVAACLGDRDTVELIFCGPVPRRTSTRAVDPQTILETIFRVGEFESCLLPDAIEAALQSLQGRPQEALVVFADASRLSEAIMGRLSAAGVPVLIALPVGGPPKPLVLLPYRSAQVINVSSARDRAGLRERFRPPRAENSFDYQLTVAGVPSKGQLITLTVGSDNAASATTRFLYR